MAAMEVENVSSYFFPKLQMLRDKIQVFIKKHQYETALFLADKVCSLSKGEVQDAYWLAYCLFLTEQYHRAAHLLKSKKLDQRFLAGRYLAAKCHYECKEYLEALDILDQKPENTNTLQQQKSQNGNVAESNAEVYPNIPCDKMESCLSLLRGKTYEALENRLQACECYRQALCNDVYCYEAFSYLVTHHMLTTEEERELIDSLPFTKQCSDEETELLRFLYENKVKKYGGPIQIQVPKSLIPLEENMDVHISQAERLYYSCHFKQCYQLTTRVLSKDPYNESCLPLHIAVLVELKIPNELFYLAHKLVDMYPSKAVSWLAVGCYYLLLGKNEPARRYLSKATSVQRVFGPAWLAFGHSFAAENEHDQAMAAYFTASHIMRGCHLPVLYVGLEYGLTNNSKLAERFFTQALSISPDDPFVLHEMGTVAFQNTDYLQAEHYFKSALEKIRGLNEDIIAEKWEPLLNNLGHVCRKLKKYEEALEYHGQALVLVPQKASTYTALGYVHALTGRHMEAVDYFHKALGLRRDDTFSTTMLTYSMEKLMEDTEPYDHDIEPVPEKPFAGSLAALSGQSHDQSSSHDQTTDTPPSPTNQLFADASHDRSSILETDASIGDSSNMAIDTSIEYT